MGLDITDLFNLWEGWGGGLGMRPFYSTNFSRSSSVIFFRRLTGHDDYGHCQCCPAKAVYHLHAAATSAPAVSTTHHLPPTASFSPGGCLLRPHSTRTVSGSKPIHSPRLRTVYGVVWYHSSQRGKFHCTRPDGKDIDRRQWNLNTLI